MRFNKPGEMNLHPVLLNNFFMYFMSFMVKKKHNITQFVKTDPLPEDRKGGSLNKVSLRRPQSLYLAKISGISSGVNRP
jgi:hypothetical protein